MLKCERKKIFKTQALAGTGCARAKCGLNLHEVDRHAKDQGKGRVIKGSIIRKGKKISWGKPSRQ